MRRIAQTLAVLVLVGFVSLPFGGTQVIAEPPPIVNVTYSTGESSDGPLGAITLHIAAKRDPFEWLVNLVVSDEGWGYPLGTYDLIVLCYAIDPVSVGVSLRSVDLGFWWEVQASASGTIRVETGLEFWEDEGASVVIQHVDGVLSGVSDVGSPFPCATGP